MKLRSKLPQILLEQAGQKQQFLRRWMPVPGEGQEGRGFPALDTSWPPATGKAGVSPPRQASLHRQSRCSRGGETCGSGLGGLRRRCPGRCWPSERWVPLGDTLRLHRASRCSLLAVSPVVGVPHTGHPRALRWWLACWTLCSSEPPPSSVGFRARAGERVPPRACRLPGGLHCRRLSVPPSQTKGL